MRLLKALAEPALAIAAGVIAAYGFPPNGIGLLTLVGLAVFAWRLPRASPRAAAGRAWLFATAWHFTALAWVSEAFLVTFPGIGVAALAPVFGEAAQGIPITC